MSLWALWCTPRYRSNSVSLQCSAGCSSTRTFPPGMAFDNPQQWLYPRVGQSLDVDLAYENKETQTWGWLCAIVHQSCWNSLSSSLSAVLWLLFRFRCLHGQCLPLTTGIQQHPEHADARQSNRAVVGCHGCDKELYLQFQFGKLSN